MCAVQPVLVGVSLAGALAASALTRGARATARGLRWQLPMLALVCVLNPLFSASGSTELLRVGARAVYLESLAFGACMGALMVAVVVWFEAAASVLTQDRLLGLMGGHMRSVPLVVSMAAQLMPQLLGRARTVGAVEAACTAAGPAAAPKAALTRRSGMLLSWALEDSLERADSMRARGWESGLPRTSYRPERFSAGDAAKVAGLLALAAACAFLAWVACAQWRFYPSMPRLVAWWGYLPWAVLCAVPVVAELVGRRSWLR